MMTKVNITINTCWLKKSKATLTARIFKTPFGTKLLLLYYLYLFIYHRVNR